MFNRNLLARVAMKQDPNTNGAKKHTRDTRIILFPLLLLGRKKNKKRTEQRKQLAQSRVTEGNYK